MTHWLHQGIALPFSDGGMKVQEKWQDVVMHGRERLLRSVPSEGGPAAMVGILGEGFRLFY